MLKAGLIAGIVITLGLIIFVLAMPKKQTETSNTPSIAPVSQTQTETPSPNLSSESKSLDTSDMTQIDVQLNQLDKDTSNF